MASRYTKKEREALDKKIVKMYVKGYSNEVIASTLHVGKSSIKTAVVKAGVYVERRGAILNSKEGKKEFLKMQKKSISKGSFVNNVSKSSREDKFAEEKMKQAVTVEDIAKVRREIKVGSHITIRTDKGMNKDMNSKNTLSGVVRQAEVINVNNPKFCLVRIESNGVVESIMWRDIVIAKKNQKAYVG